jgi:hypothetical protein
VKLIVGERIAELNIANFLALDQHIGFTDGVTFGI